METKDFNLLVACLCVSVHPIQSLADYLAHATSARNLWLIQTNGIEVYARAFSANIHIT